MARGGTGRHLNTVFEEFWNVSRREGGREEGEGGILLLPAKLFSLIDANFNPPSKMLTRPPIENIQRQINATFVLEKAFQS